MQTRAKRMTAAGQSGDPDIAMFNRSRICMANWLVRVALGLVLFGSASPSIGQQPGDVEPDSPSLTIAAFDVDGVTRLSASDIEKLVYPFVGPGKSSADIENARKSVQDAYAAKGYEAVIVESSALDDIALRQGLIRLKVNETPIGAVKVTDAKHHSARSVAQSLPSLTPGNPVNFKTLQAEITAANRFPDRAITPRFRAGAVPGTIDVELKVRDQFPLHASLELNNDNSENTTSLRLAGSARYTNLWGAGHSLTAGFVTAPQHRRDSEVFSFTYSAPILGTRWTFIGYGYRSNSDIAALGGTNVLGNGYQLGARAIYRLPTEKAYQAFSLGLDYKNFKQDVIVAGTTFRSPIEYIPVVLGYTLSKGTEAAQLEINVNATLGLRILKQEKCRDPLNILECDIVGGFRSKDVDSVENFSHLNIDASFTNAFKGDWVASARLAAQYTDAHLVTNEQFAAGGASTVRGYYQSEIVGDNGLTGSLELRSPSFATALGSFVDEFRLFGFAEAGFTKVISPLLDQRSKYSIGSVGGGARARVFSRFSGEVALGLPLVDGTTTRKGDPRILFTGKGEF